MPLLILLVQTVFIDAYTHTSGSYGRRTLTLSPSHMLERALDDYGFGDWERVTGEMKKYRTRLARSPIIYPSPLSAKNTGGVCA